MPQKRKYTHARYGDRARLSDHSIYYVNDTLGAAGERPFGNPGTPGSLAHRWTHETLRARSQTRTGAVVPWPNGLNDPLTLLCTVDLLLRMDTGIYLSAARAAELLNADYGHLLRADPVTIGRVLADLSAESANEPHRPEDAPPPLDHIRYSGMPLYVLQPDLASWCWLGRLRQHLSRYFAAWLERYKAGAKPVDRAMWDLPPMGWGTHV